MQSNSSSLVHHQDNMNAGAAIHRMEFQPPVPTCTLRYANVYNLGGKGGGGGGENLRFGNQVPYNKICWCKTYCVFSSYQLAIEVSIGKDGSNQA